MAKPTILESIFLPYFALISQLSICACEEAPPISGFTIDLIHRESPQSPSYDHSLSPSQRIMNSLRRSFNHVERFQTHFSFRQQPPQADISNARGEYLVRYSIGSPPVPSLGVADTGSDVIWTQCQPCVKCFNQRVPVFQPKSSSTYRTLPCGSANCSILKETSCSRDRKNCLYSETYGDGSFSEGDLAMDTFTLSSSGGKRVSIPNVIFGCGVQNSMVFEGGQSGIVGLGGGKTSLIRQLGSQAQGKFSYCLVPVLSNQNSSKLNFGSNAVVSGKGVVSTPLVNKNQDTFYYLTLNGISVGKQRLVDSRHQQQGNIIIDSGTTLTMLPTDLYSKLERAMESSIKLKPTKDPAGVLNLCYLTKKDIQIPNVVVHFNGADVKLRYDNVFVRTSDNLVCLAATPVENGAIYGNLAQVNFLVGYDLQKRVVSFKATSCDK